MKFQACDEMENFSFDDSAIEELRAEGDEVTFTFRGAVVRADNSQNSRYQDMYCGTIVLRLMGAKIARFIKEGYKYFDADGTLLEQVPDEDVPEPARAAVIGRCAGGTVFTVVKEEVEEGSAFSFGIDVPKEEDEEEVDTYWLCIIFEHSEAMWDRYCNPVEN